MQIAQDILNGKSLTKEEAYNLYTDESIDTMTLLDEAYAIRKHYYGKKVKLNMILNAKSGICPEDCGYCGQSRDMKRKDRYALIPENDIVAGANAAAEHQIGTYCIVMSGRGPSDKEVDHITSSVKQIKQTHPELKVCACLGIANDDQAQRLKDAGVDRYNHNLNTSENYHDTVVTTHSYEQRVNTVEIMKAHHISCLLYTSPSPRDRQKSRMPSSA